MQENSRLRYAGLLQFFIGTLKHHMRNTDEQDLIRLFKQESCFITVVVKVFAHTSELGSLSGKDVCALHILCHLSVVQLQGLRGKDSGISGKSKYNRVVRTYRTTLFTETNHIAFKRGSGIYLPGSIYPSGVITIVLI